ncbi:hypothetical protein CNMCM8927_001419 [Aspergillus lentulus]|uniref:Metallo-beta-lactamase domain-containing protein n=1 Tax=Aspergillus lentulus TaxID=293939 RepID=A0AAN6BL06_ASPLE|nr:hypothetical protein CNMCM8060_001625 [Aspergillus lentulus]KAF4191931.1 hypothetical protein CNMCM8694_001102 [Aspergillus lentulus]KAF4201524.1 hypothetical protein CNMCM8927_001419 [Aspergillus lentulus]
MVLNYKVFHSNRNSATRDAPSGHEHVPWVPTTSTLIYGNKEAVLVDTQLTKDAVADLVKWVTESGKILIYIYITHSHGDHYFGNGALLKQFPNAKVVSTPEVVAGMAAEIAPERMEAIWYKLFPGQIPEDMTAAATALKGDQFDIEGEKIQ